jgi:P27 family predicted phage terminase small subunit
MKKSEPPDHLTAEAKKLWQRLVHDFSIEDAAGHLLLRNALEAHDRLTEIRAILAEDGPQVADRFGQRKSHPLLASERDCRQQILASLRLLRLEPEALG